MAYIVRQQGPSLGFGQPELVGWSARLHGFGEPSEAMNTMSSDIIGFAFDKADLGPAQLAEIDRWARSILAQETRKIRRVQLIGHTDPVGSPQYNKTLGQRRADIVRQALITALESKRPGSSKSIAITTDSAGELRPISGLPPFAQRRVHVTTFMDPPPPPPPPPPPREYRRDPSLPEPPRMGPARPGEGLRREECPESWICRATEEYLRDLQRKKQFLSAEDVEQAMKIEHEMLRRYRQQPRSYDVKKKGVKYQTWLQEMRAEAYRRLRRFAEKVSWMPFPRP